MKKHYRKDNDCLNCGTELQGHFCHVCGQENLHVKEPFWHFLSHSISHYFHFDEKFFSTLKPLLTKPGFLTQQYLEGKRTRFLHPVSMYIFVSIIYFLIIPHLNHQAEKDDENNLIEVGSTHNVKKTSIVDSVEEAKKAISKIPFGRKAQDKVQKELAKAMLKAQEKEQGEQFAKLSFGKQTQVIDSLKTLSKINKADSISNRIDYFSEVHAAREDSTYSSYLNRQSKLPEDERDNIFERWSKRKDIQIKQKTNKDWNLDKEIEHYQPKLYFILMPLFAFFLMLNFRNNHKYYVEHIVFTIHCFTAFFIFEIIVQPINHFIFHNSSFFWNLIMYAAIAWYSYKALTLFYGRPRGVTTRKMITLYVMYFIAFGISYEIIYMVIYLTA